jgi:hypothetical protein
LTVTIADDSIPDGSKLLRSSITKLRRTKAFRSIVGGRGQIECVPCTTGELGWLVHAHMAVWSRSSPDPANLKVEWQRIVSSTGLPGNLDLEYIAKPFVAGKSGGRFSPVAFYCSKRRRSELLSWSNDQIIDFARGMKGVRTTIAFGSTLPAAEGKSSQAKRDTKLGDTGVVPPSEETKHVEEERLEEQQQEQRVGKPDPEVRVLRRPHATRRRPQLLDGSAGFRRGWRSGRRPPHRRRWDLLVRRPVLRSSALHALYDLFFEL